MSSSDQISVSREIAAPAEAVWALVADVTRMGEWSPENEGAVWLGGATSAVPGAKFKGTNRNGSRTWTTTGTIVDAEPGRSLAFNVSAKGFAVAEWRYTFEPTDAGCRVTETWTDHRNGLMKKVAAKITGVPDRPEHNQAGMEQTLERLQAAAEAGD